MKKTIASSKRNVVGGRIRQARLQQKPLVSQDDLAGRLAGLGVSLDRTAISRIENYSRYAMDYEVKAIARALNVSIAWLFSDRV
jgi:transcriptional regulator with XRE-family HTH domain